MTPLSRLFDRVSGRASKPLGSGVIPERVWTGLVNANREAARAGWAEIGVFAPAVGPEFAAGGRRGLLYVGKSAGPLGTAVGSVHDQAVSSAASQRWMLEFRNRSPFWQFVDKVDPTRRTIAWTNVCKMDRKGGARPPLGSEWRQISDACISALESEIAALAPAVIVFATSDAYRDDVQQLVIRQGFEPEQMKFDDGWTKFHRNKSGCIVVQTRHPQGWGAGDRDRVVGSVKELLRAC
jgi:hypothetical protein